MPYFLKQLAANTYYLPVGVTNVGVYISSKESCVLIDSGSDKESASIIMDAIKRKRVKIEAVLHTHSHADNCGGSYYLRKNSKTTKFLATQNEALIIENPKRSNYVAYKIEQIVEDNDEKESKEDIESEENEEDNKEDKEPTPKIRTTPIIAKPCLIDKFLYPGRPYITKSGKKIEILDFGGHTRHQIGVKTPDGVLFIADSVSSEKDLDDNPIPYIENVSKAKATLEYLLHAKENMFVPTHGEIYDFSITSEVYMNRQQIGMIEDSILLHLQVPRTKEELVALLFQSFQIKENVPNFYSIMATISSFLEELRKSQKITVVQEGGKARWFSI